MDSFEAAVEKKCNFIVHHGIFWNYNRENRITHAKKRKLKFLFDNGLSLYASHLPLDLHPICGNNQKLFELIGLSNRESMGFYQGIPIGLMGTLEKSVSFSEFCIDLEDKLNDKVKSYKFSDKPVTKIAMLLVKVNPVFLRQRLPVLIHLSPVK